MKIQFIVKIFKNLSFRRKLFSSYVIVAIIPIIVLGLFSYVKAKSSLQEQFRMGMNETISQISGNVDDKLKRQDEFINFISFNTVLREVLDKEDIDPFTLQQKMNDSVESAIWYYMSINKEIKKLSIYSETRSEGMGSFIGSAKKVENEAWYKETKNRKSTYWWYKDGELFASHSILNMDNNKIIGAVCLSLDIDDIVEDIKTSKFQKYDFIISDNSDNLIASINNLSSGSDISTYIISHFTGPNLRIGNDKYIIIKNNIPTTNWSLFGYISENKASVDTSEILKITAAIIFACLVLVGFIIWLFSSTFVNRITNLNKKIEIVEQGDLKIEISSEAKDEIGELTNKFGNMLKKINSLITEVYQSKIDRKEALLKSLQAQINPHFLYNSLSMINWKAIDAGESEISNITKLLSKFYRTTLNKGKSIICIKEEIENIKAYIEIQLMMHDNEFQVEYIINDEIYEYDMLNFILQPIVENAILHGIDEGNKEKGILKIVGQVSENAILFSIEDNGAGIQENKIKELLEKDSGGYGLKNISERIKLYFGPDYGISIKSEIGKGTSVKVSLPKYKRSSVLADIV